MQGQSFEEGRYVGVSKNWCDCLCAPWNFDLDQWLYYDNIACMMLNDLVNDCTLLQSSDLLLSVFCYHYYLDPLLPLSTAKKLSNIGRESTRHESASVGMVSMMYNISFLSVNVTVKYEKRWLMT